MSGRDLAVRAARGAHRAGAWIFDRSGILAPALARLGAPLHRWLFPGSLLADPGVPIDLGDGFRLYHEGRPSYHLQMLAMGMHDRDVERILRHLARPGMTIVDVGAHLGYFSIMSARLCGDTGTVWAFEPSRTLLPILYRNAATNGVADLVHVVPSAVGDAVREVTLFTGDTDSMLSSLHPAAAAAAGAAGAGAGECVPCTTLDAWAEHHGWPRVDLVKIDVEGHEVAAAVGMRRLCHRNPALVLIIELNERTLAAAGESVESFWAALTACGLDDVALAGAPPRPVRYPADWGVIRTEIRRQGNGRVNLVCARAALSIRYT